MRLRTLLLPLLSLVFLVAANPQMSTTSEGDSDEGNTTGESSGGGTGADTGAGAGASFLHPPSPSASLETSLTRCSGRIGLKRCLVGRQLCLFDSGCRQCRQYGE